MRTQTIQTFTHNVQEFYFREFGITDPIMQGFLNGAPYCSAALIGCWCNAPLNRHLGRRGTIFVSCAIALVTALWQAASPNWPIFLAGRLILGIAVGAKSSTAPIYAAECAPKRIRGALTMMWQMWTAFGIMLGYIASIVFQNVDFMGKYSQWRWMIGVTAVPPMIVMAATYTLPESPRWHMDRGEYKAAYETMVKLRSHPVIAARDLYVAAKFVEAEKQTMANHNNPLKELFTVGRNLRAVQSAWFCMFMQQFCGGTYSMALGL
jgi:MFS family permease